MGGRIARGCIGRPRAPVCAKLRSTPAVAACTSATRRVPGSVPPTNQGHRPVQAQSRRPRSRRGNPQQPAPEHPRMENPCRSSRRTPTLPSGRRNYDDPLKPGNTCRSDTPSDWPKKEPSPPSAPEATPMRTPWPLKSLPGTWQTIEDFGLATPLEPIGATHQLEATDSWTDAVVTIDCDLRSWHY